MVNPKTREWFKHVLWISRVKLIYARITLTRYTTLYFYLALLSCLTLAILQSQTYASNSEGAYAVAGFLTKTNVNTTAVGMSFLQDGDVVLCHNIPGQKGANCFTLVERTTHSHLHVRDTILSFDGRAPPPLPPPDDLQQCALSLMWLEDVLSDARREDLGILVYQIWLMTLSVMTLLNESLPHLFAGLAARVLATAWAGFRVQGNINLYSTYLHVITAGECHGFDPLGGWWNESGAHEIAGLVSNAVNLVLMAGLSYKLFNVYVSKTFSRVGASAEVNRIYKLVLLLSVVLQLAGFFTLVQTALWVSKISFGSIRQFAEHFAIYLAGLIVTAVLEIPWLILGWISVRRESKTLFLVFACISVILFFTSTALFFSPLNRFVIKEWSFYATMSVTSSMLLIATFVLAIVCRLQYGKGLAHFLHVSDALDEGDFTPVYFSKGDEDDPASIKDEKFGSFDSEMPSLGYSAPQRPDAAHTRKPSTLSVLFAKDTQAPVDTIHLSSTPDLFRSMTEAKKSKTTATAAPIVVMPVTRSTSITSNLSSSSRGATRPPNVSVGPPELPETVRVSPMMRKHARADTVDARPGRDRSTSNAALTKPAPTSARSRSVPRRGGGLPQRPSDGKGNKPQPPGNYF